MVVMPREGYGVVTLRKKVLELAREHAKKSGKSLSKVVEEAIEQYIHDRRRLENKIIGLIKLLEEQSD